VEDKNKFKGTFFLKKILLYIYLKFILNISELNNMFYLPLPIKIVIKYKF